MVIKDIFSKVIYITDSDNLRSANLQDTNLQNANLWNADLRRTIGITNTEIMCRQICPPSDGFIGWKKGAKKQLSN